MERMRNRRKVYISDLQKRMFFLAFVTAFVSAFTQTLAVLIGFSEDWAAENSCYGYRPNEKSDIEGNRIFLAEEDGGAVGYLFGKVYPSKQMQSIMPEGTPYFEVEELYVVPERRSRGIGMKLFSYAEEAVKAEAVPSFFAVVI